MRNADRNRRPSVKAAVSLMVLAGMGVAAFSQDVGANRWLEARTHRDAIAALRENAQLERNPYAVLVKFSDQASVSTRTAAKASAKATTIR